MGPSSSAGDENRGRKPLTHVLVDEYQDTNPIQEEIYLALARDPPHSLLVVGDDDQSMYRFRGGSVDSIVRFGSLVQERWKAAPARVDLHDNFRSHPQIVESVNRFITHFPIMRKPGVRAPGKQLLVAKSDVSGDYPVILRVEGDVLRDVADRITELLLGLQRKGLISDWRDVGVLLPSTRETRTAAGPYVESFRQAGIKVYNPRSRALHNDPMIQQLLGALTSTLDKNLSVLEGNYVGGRPIRGRSVDAVRRWVASYDALAKTNLGKPLGQYVKKSQQSISKLPPGKLLNTTVMDVLYRILSFEPFRSKRDEANNATRLALITSLLDSFTAFREGRGLLRTSTRISEGGLSTKLLQPFYYEFAGFIEDGGLNDPEDPEDLLPHGHIQVMTVHQSKGLEFPIVIAGGLDAQPREGRDHWAEEFLAQWCARKALGTSLDRATQDLIRKYYVAYSRAKNLLVLPVVKGSPCTWGLGA